MTAHGDLDRSWISKLLAQELTRFREARPRSLALIGRARAHMPNGMPMAWMASDYDQPVYIDYGQGPGFTDVDGFSYAEIATHLGMSKQTVPGHIKSIYRKLDTNRRWDAVKRARQLQLL